MDEPEVRLDKQNRVLGPDGRPLRQRQRPAPAAFRGKKGKPHPRAEKLAARQKAWDDDKTKLTSYKRPGSFKK